MSSSDTKYLNINLVIADRPYPLKVSPQEEENVRRAARAINQKVKEYQRQYDAKDKQDYLAMCALWFASEALGSQQDSAKEDPTLAEKLHKLDALLSEQKDQWANPKNKALSALLHVISFICSDRTVNVLNEPTKFLPLSSWKGS